MVTIIKNFREFSTLDVDAMFFHAAMNSFQSAIENKTSADNANDELHSIEWLDDYEMWDLGDEIDISFDDEASEYVEGLKDKVSRSYSVFLQSVASIHIFSAAALEAHINKIGAQKFSGKTFDNFEKLSLDGKWLFLPKLLNLGEFVPGKQPFQGFLKLIRIRNLLIHYKSKKIPYDSDKAPGQIYEKLGFTIKDANKSIETSRSMIMRLAELLEIEPPKWINDIAVSYFRIEYEYDTEEI